ncbi:D-alanyl-D-alanine carboxypeptidase [Mesorhizobium albiziae]|uniref:D-alanyl-D-alanine carboxypeptidase n=1 Tax=Neomesorhizobium albiziae TaxID=335020 RepID=A0A1I3X8S4_9HYPH|nr:D-alanyl-D-alanine carboxypeptidase family protein [Mesorhizobium albiziae]GLS30621.1 D-alanyl-D-alanine carboxypeptidase [Mesorhizobium albiziae]SFK15994.1 D-alanyl-D-alanine carboxypeptidase [Mesorhizobium albiziae]
MRQLHFLRTLFVGASLSTTLLAGGANANPSLLFDLQTGQVLAHEEAFQRWHPASLTKLMTAYVTFRAIQAGELDLTSPIKVSKNSASEQPAKMGYKPGSVMTLDNALKMMLVRSANDIAMAIGENVGGTKDGFVARMNAEAARLGMSDSHFSNPNGLHADDQYTTAHDLALLVMAMRREYPQYAPYFSIEGLLAGKKKLGSFNLLVGRYAGADGMKTGFICPSGFNMIGSATRNGRTLVAVILGEKTAVTRAEVAAKLLDQGFANPNIGAQTVAGLTRYGEGTGVVRNVRDEVCPKPVKGQKAEQPSEQASEKVKSPFLEKLDHPPKLIAVGLGNATGKVPAAYAAAVAAGKAADVDGIPIPTPRPNYTATTASSDTPEAVAKPAKATVGG